MPVRERRLAAACRAPRGVSGTSKAGSLRPGSASSGDGICVFSGFSIVINFPSRFIYT